MKRKTLTGFLIALSLVPHAHAGIGDAIAGGAVAGLVTGVINAATQHRQPQTVVIEKRTVVVHDRAVQQRRSSKKSLTTDPSPSLTPQPPSTPPAPSVPVVATMPVVATVAPTPAPTPSGPVLCGH